ncbi:MAG: competence protein CoiA family protein, partial [Anaeromyxobacteraceae bacterium]
GPRSRQAPGRARDVLLLWANDRAGAKVRADRLAPAERRGRAPFTCLGCGDEVVAKLGPLRAHHFAHRPGSTCPLTRPETALHLDAKERLLALAADAFAGRRAVRLAARCPRCRREAAIDLALTADAAVAEGAAGSLRCDVLLTKGGAPALALEVKVTHAVDAAKEAALDALGLRALEIDAREEWLREDGGGATVLPARSLGFAPCAACEASARADVERARGGEAAAIAELEAYRARGLMGPAPGRPLAATAVLGGDERAAIARAFRCPECGGRGLSGGERLVRHGCPGGTPRPVAWRGYDGTVVQLGWWSARG